MDSLAAIATQGPKFESRPRDNTTGLLIELSIFLFLFQIGEMDQCPLGDELLELVIREEDLVNRNVRASNLNNLRKRIVSKFLQLIRSPDHNPEIIRYEKVKIMK